MSTSPERERRQSSSQSFDGSTSSVGLARSVADGFLADHAVDLETRERVALVVSELATNAVDANPDTPYELWVGLPGDGLVRVEVTNRADPAAVPAPQHWGPEAMLAPRGRGLLIVRSLSESVEVDRSRPGVVTVCATLRPAGSPTPESRT